MAANNFSRNRTWRFSTANIKVYRSIRPWASYIHLQTSQHMSLIKVKAKVKLKLSLCLTKHHAIQTYEGSKVTSPRIVNVGTRWSWVVNFTPRPLYPRCTSPLYPLNRRLGGLQSQSGCGGEEKNFLHLEGIKLQSSGPWPSHYSDWAIPAPYILK
jgi:hypothetical protein